MPTEQQIHSGTDVGMHGPAMTLVHLNRQRERGFCSALQHRLLTAPSPGLIVTEGDRLDPANQIAEGWVLDQVGQGVAWAVATSITPRSAIVRAAWASSSVPISSITITSGMWFSTASIIT